ncbi:flavin nucleotide-binding protein, putative [Syntrophotalea carbinolica DSM 2380]|uniref:Flavin nucleotide-binding protein, putative n=1 Tax=Syntrophotalea carbinolica (strain DSM 2380 / NBRC 103641 / GraBd1) TaxID=338963 RepID=Q3A865_SYNC1|nr:pyridoxamine 5'-phosphate oxidase family protein [Syntrophotalea carbinolica]ABA87427.1 flavin nucleotide-binding protein, putative [Syntrophotalea carbinolica DSM 2380]
MRRSDLEITSTEEVEAIIRQSNVCRLGLCDGDMPYVVPLNFGYEDGKFYFHSASEGRKVELLKANPKVCLEFDMDLGIISDEKACNWGIRYKSVIVTGRATVLNSLEEKVQALNIIMKNYSDKDYTFAEKVVKDTFVFVVESQEITGKQTDESTIVQ